jgi:segregation and condensation protein A
MGRMELEPFDGPLDLLLSLVESERLSLSDVSLAHVTERFLQEVRTRAEQEVYPLESLVHFLVIASKLVAMKARLLFPNEVFEEEDDASLVERLQAYQAYVRAGAWLGERWSGTPLSYGRGERTEVGPPVLPVAPELGRVREAYLKMLARVKKPAPPPPRSFQLERLVTLEERMSALAALLRERGTASFFAWVPRDASSEVRLVSFLAVLELVREHKLTVTQTGLFSDITLSSV